MPSLLSVGTAALACVGSAAAKQWYLRDSYDASNFFDKFDFIDNAEGGHVQYQSKRNAFDLGLASYDGDEVYLGVDHKTLLQGAGFAGRPSVRIESKAEYNHGLFIARFTHLPEAQCGTWPQFFTFGAPQPMAGQIDIYEGGNGLLNQPSLHTGSSDQLGSCKLDGEGQTSPVSSNNCDNTFQSKGCVSSEHNGPFATPDGGVYAVEWTTDFIKLYSWTWNNVPDDVDSDEPNTDSWGAPSVYLKNKNCDIDDHFVNQKLVFNIDICGAPEGKNSWDDNCQATTGSESCIDYVSNSPEAFANAFFKIQDIRYFKGIRPTNTIEDSAEETERIELRDVVYGAVDLDARDDFVGTVGSTSTFTTRGPFTNTSTVITTTETGTTTLTTTETGTTETGTTTGTETGTTTGTTATETGTTTGTETGTTTGTTGTETGTTTGTETTATGTETGTTTGTTGTETGTTTGTETGTTGTETGTTTGTETGTTGTETGTTTGTETTGTATGTTGTETETVTKTGTETGSATGTTGTETVTETGTETGTKTKPTGTETGPITTITATGSVTSTIEMTTSTVYTTVTETITKCPPGVSCNGGHGGTTYITTKTIALYTTVCPASSEPTITGGSGGSGTTITETITKVYTISACPPEVTDCPYGKTVTEYITTTYCPGNGEGPTAPATVPSEPTPVVVTKTVSKGFVPPSAFTPGGCVGDNCPAKTTVVYKTEGATPTGGSGSGSGSGSGGSGSGGSGSGSGSGTKPSGFETVSSSAPASPSSTECTGDDCVAVVTAGAAKTGFSLAVVLGALVAMMV